MFVSFKPELGDPILRFLSPHRLQNTDRDHVFGFRESATHGHGAIEGAVVVFGLPSLAARDACIEKQRGIVDDGSSAEAIFECCRVNEGFEAGARLTPGLRDMVEFVFFVIKAADQCAQGPRSRIDCNECALYLWQLRDLPSILGCFGDTYHCAAPDLDVGRGIGVQTGLSGLEPFADDLQCFCIAPHRYDLLRTSFEHHRSHDLIAVWRLRQCVFHCFFQFVLGERQTDEFFWASIDLSAFKVHDPFA